jgi:hypothetical protein
MLYTKNANVSGAWIKGKDVVSGTKAKLISETIPVKSQFKDKNGNDKTQDVAKIKFEGNNDILNISLNRATIDGLIDTFGEDSKNWKDKVLTALTEKVIVGGKRVVALYLIPEGCTLEEDSDGYMHIVNPNKSTLKSEQKSDLPEVDEFPPLEGEEDGIKVDEIPF